MKLIFLFYIVLLISTKGDINGRKLRIKVGEAVFDRAQFYIYGKDLDRAKDLSVKTPWDFCMDSQQLQSLGIDDERDKNLDSVADNGINTRTNYYFRTKNPECITKNRVNLRIKTDR